MNKAQLEALAPEAVKTTKAESDFSGYLRIGG